MIVSCYLSTVRTVIALYVETVSDHVGHKVKKKVSQVVETQLRQLEESLSNDNSILFLRELLNNSESRQKHLRERSESLLRNVVDREK